MGWRSQSRLQRGSECGRCSQGMNRKRLSAWEEKINLKKDMKFCLLCVMAGDEDRAEDKGKFLCQRSGA